MINSINPGSVPSVPMSGSASAQPTAPAAVQAQPATPSPRVDTADSVQISVSAQAKNMKDQGLSISQIAVQLGLDTKTIAGYLGEDVASLA